MRFARFVSIPLLSVLAACSGGDDLTVTSGLLANGTEGEAYSATLAAAGGSGAGYKWRIVSGELPGGLELSTDGTISGTPTLNGEYDFVPEVEDSEGNKASKTLRILIGPAADGDVTIQTATLPDGEVGLEYNAPLFATGGVGNFTWSITSGSLPDGLRLSAGGDITGTPTTEGQSTVTIRAVDTDGGSDEATFTITISAPTTLTITTTNLPNGVVGMPYSGTVQSINGMGVVTWLVSSGSLPMGLTIETMGASTMISGTPTRAGTMTFTLTASDDNRQTMRELTIEILDSPSPLEIVTTMVPTGTVGVAYSATILAQNGSNMGYQWQITGSLPDGLTIATDGTPSTTVSGTPTAAGTSTVTIEVRDSAGGMASQTVDFTIRHPPLAITPAAVPGGEQGEPYSATLTATGGSGGGYTWNIDGGSLPMGITLSDGGATATLEGTPTTLGLSTFDLRLEDNAGGRIVATYSIEIFTPLRIDTQVIGAGYVGTATTTTVLSTGGSGMGQVWAVSAGALPPGWTVTGNGASATVGGTATAAGNYGFTISVTDSAGIVETQTYNVDIYDPISIATLTLPTATTAIAYSENLTTTGGAPGAVTWTLVGGALPPGLALGTPGQSSIPVEGIPTTLGQYTFVVQADDALASTDTATISMTVYQPLQIDTAALPIGANGILYSATVEASGGSTMGYTWTTTGMLPPGLQLLANGTPSTLLTGAPTQQGSFTFTINVTDSGGEMASATYTLDIVPPLDITTTLIPGRFECQPGSTTLQTTGGSGTGHVWTVTGGTIPTGWTLQPDGSPDTTIYGRATTPGVITFTLTVTDDAGLTDSQPYVVTITPDPSAQRRSIVVGDLSVNNETSVFLVDVCGDAPGPLVQLNPPGGTTGDAATTSDLAGFSPDGSLITFVGDFASDGNNDLWLVDPSVNPPAPINLTNYTATGANVTDVFWAPSSTLIAFIADPVVDGRSELFVVDVSNPAMPSAPVLASSGLGTAANDVSANDVFWSPNSQRIVFHADADTDGVTELYYVNMVNPAAPVAPVKIHPALAGAQDVEDEVFWAPSSRGVVFRADIAALNQNELWFTDLDAANPTAVRVNSAGYAAANDVGTTDYRFAPAGVPRAFYLADETIDGSEEIFIVNLNAGTFTAPARAIAALPAGRTVTHARWSPDGNRLAFRADLDVNDRYDLYVVDVSGTLPAVPTRVTTLIATGDLDISTTDGFSFLWSPNGQRLAYIADADIEGVDQAYVAEVGSLPYTSQPITFGTDPNFDASQLFWSGDSQRVAVRGDFNANSRFELVLVDVSGAGPYTPVAVNLPIAGGQDVSSGAGAFQFRRDSLGLFFEADMIVDNDTESYMVDFSSGVLRAPVPMHPMLPGSGDVSYFYVEP